MNEELLMSFDTSKIYPGFQKIKQELENKYSEKSLGYNTETPLQIDSFNIPTKKQQTEDTTIQTNSRDLLQQYLEDPNQDRQSKEEAFRALQDGVDPQELIDYLEQSGYTGMQNQPQEKKTRTAIREELPSGFKEIAKDNLGVIANTIGSVPEISRNITEGAINNATGIVNEALQVGANISGNEINPLRNPIEVLRGDETHTPSLIERGIDSLQTGSDLGVDALNAWSSGEQGGLETTFQVLSAGTLRPVLDIVGDGFVSTLSTLTPQEQKDFVLEQVQNVADTKGGKYVVSKINDIANTLDYLKEENPRAFRNMVGLLTTMEGVVEALGFSGGKKAVTKLANEVTDTLDSTRTGLANAGNRILNRTGQNIEGNTIRNRIANKYYDTLENLSYGEEVGSFKVNGNLPEEKLNQSLINTGIYDGETGNIENLLINSRTAEQIRNGGDNLSIREKLSGLSQRQASALEKINQTEFDTRLGDAYQAKNDSYVQSPYHKSAGKAEEAFKILEKDIDTNANERLDILKNAKQKINNTQTKNEIDDALRKTFNIDSYSIAKNGDVTLNGVKGRVLGIQKEADKKALLEINELLKANTPIEQYDRIRILQQYLYNRYSSTDKLQGISKEMGDFLERAVGIANSNLKKQLAGTEYEQIVKALSDDIVLKNELNRIFDVSEGVSNRGESAIKKLTSGTTTGGEARKVALDILDRTGIDLINEAELAKFFMNVVDDPRASTLFDLIDNNSLIKSAKQVGGRLFGGSPITRGRKRAGKNIPKKKN